MISKNRTIGWFTLMLLIVLLCLPALAHAQADGGVEGQVLNGTEGATPIGAGIPVALHVVQGDVELEPIHTTTGADGRFQFEGLDRDAGSVYRVEALYLDVLYSGDTAVQFEDDQETVDVSLTVYETTEDDANIRLNAAHIIAESFGEMLRVSEIHLFGNSGDMTYVGSGPNDGVFISLPDEAVGLGFQEGTAADRYAEVDGGVLDTQPVPPGSESAVASLSYHLMAPGGAVPLERSFGYPVDSVSVLAAQPGLTLQSDQMQSMGPETFQGRQYEYYMTQDLAPGAVLAMDLVPQAGAMEPANSGAADPPQAAGTVPQGNQELLRWLGLALVAAVVVGAVAYPLATRGMAPTTPATPDMSADPRARQLISELAKLEDANEAGELDEADFQREYVEKQEEIKSLWS